MYWTAAMISLCNSWYEYDTVVSKAFTSLPEAASSDRPPTDPSGRSEEQVGASRARK